MLKIHVLKEQSEVNVDSLTEPFKKKFLDKTVLIPIEKTEDKNVYFLKNFSIFIIKIIIWIKFKLEIDSVIKVKLSFNSKSKEYILMAKLLSVDQDTNPSGSITSSNLKRSSTLTPLNQNNKELKSGACFRYFFSTLF